MSDLSRSDVLAALAELKDPETGRGLAEMGQLGDVRVAGNQVTVSLALSTYSAPLWQATQQEVKDFLLARWPHLTAVTIQLSTHDRPPQKLGPLGVPAKSIIAVGSGKGGVGKSTIAASLAIGLARAGSKVGLLDADVYGPSIPHLLGSFQTPEVVQARIQPLAISLPGAVGSLKMISIGLLVPPGEAVVWRGPMLHRTLTQFLRDVAWDDLDYLLIDMPPGTGDVALSLSQLVPLTGAVVVCTPQEVALLDAVKAIDMFRKVNIPVLGMIENMSGFVCPDCQKRYDIFGSGGAKRRAAELGVPFLGDVPITIAIREHGDAGQTRANFDDPQAAPYLESIIRTLAGNLASMNRATPPLPTLSVL